MTPTPRRTVLLTGAASGIGAATARRFLREGWQVAINHLDGQQAEAAAIAAHATAPGQRALCIAGDVTRDDDCVRVVHETVTAFGALHVLVNAAGISRMIPHTDLHALTLSTTRTLAPQVRVNAVCPVLVEQGFVERLAPESFADRAAHQKQVSPLQRLGHPDEVAEAIHWLATSASMMTGSIVELDFGMHLNAV